MARKKINAQKKFRIKTFATHQYWNINYTEHLADRSQKDFKVFIKAKSYEEAKNLLQDRLSHQNPPATAKAIQGFMFHKNYKGKNNVRLGIKQWEQIRNASFPNANNLLYKLEIPRSPEKSNRFNATDHHHLSKIGFKKGKENWSTKHRKGIILPLEDREGMIYHGKWVKWNKAAKDSTRKSLISALVKCNGNRSKAAKELGISRHKIYCLMQKFPSIDWQKDYPPTKPFSGASKPDRKLLSIVQKKVMKKRMAEGYKPFNLSPDLEQKRIDNLKKSRRQKREKYLNSIIPNIKEALVRFSNHRTRAAKYLGMKPSTLWKIMRECSHIVNWAEEYPVSHNLKYKSLFPSDYPERPLRTVKRLNKINNT
tara:strand:- start:3064 stop:4167 length:1104 start_codon:yes stop_codon:yes gene_type:complete